ncbi:hypothetical protein [Flavobacterium adhaerens]|uniref:hypothetical protein n=1 Tax=Flavobacterium adhaerens TaxID=3149043 RepID=UPI0032B5C2CE
MKIILVLFVTLLVGNNCQDQINQDLITAKIEYVANTRGFYAKTVVENKTLSLTTERDGKSESSALTDSQLSSLIAAFEKVNLEEIPNLKAPSQKRFHDGAAMANLKITYKGKTYESQTFDHGNPPEKIKKIVNILLSFSKKEE